MNKITSIEDINALIAAGVEESTTLEYKSDINTTSDKWKGEMSKDVSAMANANGGTINMVLRSLTKKINGIFHPI